MDSLNSEPEVGSIEWNTVNFNHFILHGLIQEVVGKTNIDRIVELNDTTFMGLLNGNVREALVDCVALDLPVTPGLRTQLDFEVDQEVLLKTTYFKNFERVVIARLLETEVEVEHIGSTRSVVPITYPGLLSEEDKEFYSSNRPGRGSVYSPVGFNLEFTRLLQTVGIIKYDNSLIIKNMKRFFEANAKDYRFRTL